jgi:hypothetical protein
MILRSISDKIQSKLQDARRHRGVAGIMLDLVWHKLRANIDPRDYFKYEFYKPGKRMEEKSRYVSFHGSRYFPYENNPLKYNFIFTNKDIQKEFLRYLELPTPELLTFIGEHKEISTKDQLAAFLRSVAAPIVIKPISGTQGQGFLSLERDGNALLAGDRACSVEDVWAHISRDPRNFKKGFLVEEKVVNHPSIRSLYPHALNTYRIVTIKTSDGQWHNPCGYLRLGRDGRQVDNGQIHIFADSSARSAIAYDHIELRSVTRHPDTRCPLVGIQLEGCGEAIELALRASEKLFFMGTLGWDIAIAENGPLILEVNAWWGNVAPQVAMGRGVISDALVHGLKRRGPFSRWDKLGMNPRLYDVPLLSRVRDMLKQG